MPLTPFHIAFPVDDLDAARTFYGTTLGCPEGRSSAQWIDFDLFGHQIVAHLKPSSKRQQGPSQPGRRPRRSRPSLRRRPSMEYWETLAERLRRAGINSSSSPTSASRARSANKQPCSSSIPQATP